MISNRLLKASAYTKGFNCLADCGTDHAKLPIFCVKSGLVAKAYASDNKIGPLENATANIAKAELNGYVIPILADGLDYLSTEVDIVSILGMGGRLIVSILETADLTAVKRLVLSANSENYLLRDFLEKSQWKIIAEELIKDRNKYYQLMVLEKGKMSLTAIEKEFGPLIIKAKTKPFMEMIENLVKKLNKALVQTKTAEAKETIKTRIKILEEVIT